MDLGRLLQTNLEDEKFISLGNVSIMTVTYNVNAKLGDAGLMGQLLDSLQSSPDGIDLVVIGLQEIVELSTTNVVGSTLLGNQLVTDRVERWQSLCSSVLKDFVLVESVDMVGTLLMLFSIGSKVPLIRNIQSACVPRGVGNMFGNKGGVCIRFEAADSSICFVNSHLSAHREAVLKRNEDYQAIISQKVFKDISKAEFVDKGHNVRFVADPVTSSLRKEIVALRSRLADQSTQSFLDSSTTRFESTEMPSAVADDLFGQNTLAIDDHDIIIWIGDLNYRLSMDITIEEAYEMIDSNLFDSLSEYDQLLQEKELGLIFAGFNEGLITFPPTYQYLVGSDEYDRRLDGKSRCPAWCDRVLWRVGKGLHRINELTKKLGGQSNADVYSALIGVFDSISAPFPNLLMQYLDSLLLPIPGASSVTSAALRLSQELSGDNADVSQLLQILHGRGTLEKVELLDYGSFSGSTISDHKPVRAILNVKYKRVDWAMREAILTQSLEKYIQDTFIKTSLVSAKSTPNPMESLWSLLGFESIIQQPIEPVMNVPSVPGCALEASLLFGTICPITVTPPFSLIHIGSSGSFERDQISELSQVVVSRSSTSLSEMFIEVLPESVPPWLTVYPIQGTISEKSLTISFKINATSPLFAPLSADQDKANLSPISQSDSTKLKVKLLISESKLGGKFSSGKDFGDKCLRDGTALVLLQYRSIEHEFHCIPNRILIPVACTFTD